MNVIVSYFVFTLSIKGIFGASLPTAQACLQDSDCASSRTCIEGFCKSPCMTICGPQALCAVVKHKTYCFCKDGTKNCFPKKESKPCVPECEKNSSCNTETGYCECPQGYKGNPYRGCSKKCKANTDCPKNEACISGACKDPCKEECGLNAECDDVMNHVAICNCRSGFKGNPFEICRPVASLFRQADICDDCGENAVCKTTNHKTKCVCPRGFVGNPYASCNKMCISSEDCATDKICKDYICKDPCEDACGVNTQCLVNRIRRKPICTCIDGYVGDPSRICTMALTPRFAEPEEEILCHPQCGANATCSTEFGICTCKQGFFGNPYGQCRSGCEEDDDCSENEACFEGTCKDPCLTACGKKALCGVKNHKAECRCPYGYIGEPDKFCREKKVTIIEVDLCDSVKCGINAHCDDTSDQKCNCLPGYSGNPYQECFKKCRSDSECAEDDFCVRGTCRKVCDSSCGINAKCRVENHLPICSCPINYKGDPLKICFPKIDGVLVNPSRVPCLKCICRAITGNSDMVDCAQKSISSAYWAFAGEDLVGGENFRTKNTTIDFITCMHNQICILNTMNDYTSRAMHRLNDIDCDGKITCADYFAVHKFGLTAKFADSIFSSSEARSFDQCDGHGDKDVHENWSPKSCTGASYVEILS